MRIPGTTQISAEKTLGSLMEALKESSRWHDEGIEALYLYANIDCMVLSLPHQLTTCFAQQAHVEFGWAGSAEEQLLRARLAGPWPVRALPQVCRRSIPGAGAAQSSALPRGGLD
jgi:hypothetical protein